jgi:predicted MFS family arabinose efflux permease
MRRQGLEFSAGIVQGRMSIGPVLAAIAIVFVPPAFTERSRWLCFGVLTLLTALLLAIASSVLMVIAGLVGAGFGIGAVIVTFFTTANQRTPPGRTTTTVTVLTRALTVGHGLFTALGGFTSEQKGSGAEFTLVATTALEIPVTGLINYVMDRPKK